MTKEDLKVAGWMLLFLIILPPIYVMFVWYTGFIIEHL